jgi:PAS domain S-box-containing protein
LPEHFHPQDLGFGRLFDEVRDAVIVADPKTQRIVLWNRAATNIFGYSPSEALTLRVKDLVPERYRAQHRAGMKRYRETGDGPYIGANKLLDLPALLKNGKEIRVEISLSPIESAEGGSGPYVLAIIRDVTERNRAEALAAQLLGHLSGEFGFEAGATSPAQDVSLERRVPLQEVQPSALTARELDVLRLIAVGRTNRQIAKELVISLSTVKTHVEHLMDKLGVSARAQAAVRAVELGLLATEETQQ